MTEFDLRNAIEGALGTVPFEPPVSAVYCAAVRDALRATLPEAKLEVFFRESARGATEIVAEARAAGVTCTVTLPLV